MGVSTRDMTDDLDGINAQARDISFLITYAQTLPNTDYIRSRRGELEELTGEDFMLGSPSSSRRSCSASSGCLASAAGRPGTRRTRACSRRSATSIR